MTSQPEALTEAQAAYEATKADYIARLTAPDMPPMRTSDAAWYIARMADAADELIALQAARIASLEAEVAGLRHEIKQNLKPFGTAAELVDHRRVAALYTENGDKVFGIGEYEGEYEILLQHSKAPPYIVSADYVLYVLDPAAPASDDGSGVT